MEAAERSASPPVDFQAERMLQNHTSAGILDGGYWGKITNNAKLRNLWHRRGIATRPNISRTKVPPKSRFGGNTKMVESRAKSQNRRKLRNLPRRRSITTHGPPCRTKASLKSHLCRMLNIPEGRVKSQNHKK